MKLRRLTAADVEATILGALTVFAVLASVGGLISGL